MLAMNEGAANALVFFVVVGVIVGLFAIGAIAGRNDRNGDE